MFEELLMLYDKLEPLGIVAPPAHTTITAKVGILLDIHGNFIGAKYINEKNIVPCTEKSEYRTSMVAPHLIHDNLSYVGNIPGYEKRFEAYLNQLGDYVANVNDPLAQAVYTHAQKDLLLLEIQSITNEISYPLHSISVVFGIPGMTTTINYEWLNYYLERLPLNGICAVTGEPAYIPEGYPKNLRKQGDMAKLFASVSKHELEGRPVSAPGYVAAQKICHTIQWLATAPDVIAGDDKGNTYITLREFSNIHGINIGELRQKILSGEVEAEKVGNEWFIDTSTLTL